MVRSSPGLVNHRGGPSTSASVRACDYQLDLSRLRRVLIASSSTRRRRPSRPISWPAAPGRARTWLTRRPSRTRPHATLRPSGRDREGACGRGADERQARDLLSAAPQLRYLAARPPRSSARSEPNRSRPAQQRYSTPQPRGRAAPAPAPPPPLTARWNWHKASYPVRASVAAGPSPRPPAPNVPGPRLRPGTGDRLCRSQLGKPYCYDGSGPLLRPAPVHDACLGRGGVNLRTTRAPIFDFPARAAHRSTREHSSSCARVQRSLLPLHRWWPVSAGSVPPRRGEDQAVWAASVVAARPG